MITSTVLRRYGLTNGGEDHASAAAVLAEVADKDDQEEMQRLREVIRGVIVERKEELFSQMLAAISAGDTGLVSALVTRGFDLAVGSYDGRTALHHAAAEGQAHLVQLLVELSADVNAPDRWGQSPIEAAIDGQHAAAAQLLRRSGAIIALAHPTQRLAQAVHQGDVACLQLLVSMGVSINAPDFDARTALHLAAAVGDDTVGKYLISALADVGAQDRWGRTALDEAIDASNVAMVQLLMRSSAAPEMTRLAPAIRHAAKMGDVVSARNARLACARLCSAVATSCWLSPCLFYFVVSLAYACAHSSL